MIVRVYDDGSTVEETHQLRRINDQPLNTIGGLCTEMAVIYRAARREELDVDVAKSLVYMLAQLRQAFLDQADIGEHQLHRQGHISPRIVCVRRA